MALVGQHRPYAPSAPFLRPRQGKTPDARWRAGQQGADSRGLGGGGSQGKIEATCNLPLSSTSGCLMWPSSVRCEQARPARVEPEVGCYFINDVRGYTSQLSRSVSEYSTVNR